MSFFGTELKSFENLFEKQLADLYDVENRLVEALPKLAAVAHQPELRIALSNHLRETEEHVRRLEQVFRSVGTEPQRQTLRRLEEVTQVCSPKVSIRAAARETS